MLLALLLHLVLFHLLTARDVPPHKDTEYKIEKIDSCPDVGYVLKKEVSPNAFEPYSCYLCFCQQDQTAICWKRDNRRCDVDSFHYHGVGKRDTRIRRSPGFADIFFRDASRDMFDKNEAAQCKPFESSFSDDCPPADWCTGCTVCDCDANGRWDCHILSFCPDEKKKAKRKGRKVVNKKPTKKPTTKKPTPTSPKKTPTRRNKPNPPINRGGKNKAPPQKRIIRKSVPIRLGVTPGPKGKKAPLRYQKIAASKIEPKKGKIIKKNVATHKPIDIKTSKALEMEIAQKMMKKVMANLRKSVSAQVKDMSKIAQENAAAKKKKYNKNVKKPNKSKPKPNPKNVNKRNAKKQVKPTKKPNRKPSKKPVYNPKLKPTRRPVSKQYVRQKRALNTMMDNGITTLMSQGHSGEYTNTTAVLSVIPMTNNFLVPLNVNSTFTPVENTDPQNGYYKYSIGIDTPQDLIYNYEGDKGTTQVNITETFFNLIATNKSSLSSGKGTTYLDVNNKMIRLAELNPGANELKFSKWSHLKILKDKKVKSSVEKHKSVIKLISHTNKTIVREEPNNRANNKKSLERKLNVPKHKLVKLLHHPKCNLNRKINNTRKSIQKATRTIVELQNMLRNLLINPNKNATSSSPRKNRKFGILKSLKRFFNKIFKRKKTPDQFSKHHLLETLCENFGPCKVNKKDKARLDDKLKDLDEETSKILKTVKILKGLLKLVDLPQTSYTDVSKQNDFQNDIHKLNTILRGSFARNEQKELTDTQLTQIQYIKKNTQDFVQSVSRFASSLNEIITILTKHNPNSSVNNIRNDYIYKNITKDDPFQSLKNLLIKYNLVQNSFMKRMYEQLSNFENKINKNSKVSDVNTLNNSVAIENFSRNIIHNLRKLKRLAQAVSFSSGRTKREAMKDDDAIEYLLMLMEYLLKQNHPLDAAPVNDGIDLLIEAIKNAPDIKPIKKKVLEYTPVTYSEITPPSSTKAVVTENIISDDDSHSDSDKTSSEDIGRLKLEDPEDLTMKSKIDENKELLEMVADDDKEPEDKFQYDRKAVTEKAQEKIDDVTETNSYNSNNENVIVDPDIRLENSTIFPLLDMEIGDKLENQDDTIAEKSLAIESNHLVKPLIEPESGVRKFEIYTGDMDEEVISPGTVTEPDLYSAVTAEYATKALKEMSQNKMRRLNLDSIDSENIDKKTKIEWIEENFGRDVVGRDNDKEFLDIEDSNATQPSVSPPKSTVTAKKPEKSSIRPATVESEKNTKEKKAKLNAEDVMLRKQMDLLNSLDYGTERVDAYESESKDGINEDRFSSDTFPAYFV